MTLSEKASCGFVHVSVNTASPKRNGRRNEAKAGNGDGKGREPGGDAGRHEIWIHGCMKRQEIGGSAVFVSTLFEIDGNEGICGRFGRIGV